MSETAGADRGRESEGADLLGRRLSTAIVLFHGAVAEQMGLNLTDYKCLELLARRGVANPGQLSADAGLSSATTTLVLDRLQRQGLIRREPDPQDRRKIVVHVQLTPEMADRFERATRGMRARMAALADAFPETEIGVVRRYLEAATAILETSLGELKSKASAGASAPTSRPTRL